MFTLMVRLVGVFVVVGLVLVAVRVALRRSGAVERRAAEAPANDPSIPVAVVAEVSALIDGGTGVDDATAAAIGLALALEAGSANPRLASASGSPSAWAMAGRLRNLRR